MVVISGTYTSRKTEEYRGLKLDIKEDDVFELEAHESNLSGPEVVITVPWRGQFKLGQYETAKEAEEAMRVFGEQIKSGYKLRLSYDNRSGRNAASLVPPEE